jgi:hypothetical protein
MKILVLHGPNLNLLGEREPEIYGRTTLAEIDAGLRERAAERGAEADCFQSNHEGALIDRIQAARRTHQAIIINPGGLTHSGVASRRSRRPGCRRRGAPLESMRASRSGAAPSCADRARPDLGPGRGATSSRSTRCSTA